MRAIVKLLFICSVAKAANVDKDEELEQHVEEEHAHWEYEGKYGPDNWAKMSSSCGGLRQSPVNIVPQDTIKISSKDEFAFLNFDVLPKSANLSNNGHTAQLVLSGLGHPDTVCGLLPGEYEFARLHFHWGRDSGEGSEHLLDGKAFPLEMHLVFFKKEHGSVNKAIIHPYGVAVLGVWFTETDGPSPPPYKDLARSLENITKTHSFTLTSNDHALFDYLPMDMSSFFRYTGSLTTPPCIEPIIWTVFENSIPINSNDLDQFRKLEDPHGETLKKSFRPAQKLNDRHVHRYVAVADDDLTATPFADIDDFMYRGLYQPFCPVLSAQKPYKKQTTNYI